MGPMGPKTSKGPWRGQIGHWELWARLPVRPLFHELVPGTASYSGPKDCLIVWSQGLLHTLVPGTASYPGPMYCLIPWSHVLPHILVQKT